MMKQLLKELNIEKLQEIVLKMSEIMTISAILRRDCKNLICNF